MQDTETSPDAMWKYKVMLFTKLNKARIEFMDKHVAARGENNFNHFNYITLKDIVDNALPILVDNGLALHHMLYQSPPVVEVIDLDTGYGELFGSNYNMELEGKNTNQKLQALGSSETYLRRYIYLQILDIVEQDPDVEFGKPESKQKGIKINQKQQSMPKKSKPSKPEPTKNDITTEQIKEILDKAYEKLTNAGIDFTIENADFTIKRLCNNQTLYERCIETLQYKGGGVN